MQLAGITWFPEIGLPPKNWWLMRENAWKSHSHVRFGDTPICRNPYVDITWCNMMLHDMITWHDRMILRDVTWYHLILHTMTWYCMMLHDITVCILRLNTQLEYVESSKFKWHDWTLNMIEHCTWLNIGEFLVRRVSAQGDRMRIQALLGGLVMRRPK